MKFNGFGASQDSTVPGGTRPSPKSAKTFKNILKIGKYNKISINYAII